MNKEPFDLDRELSELEQELEGSFENLGAAPLRAGFQEELQVSLQKEIGKKTTGREDAGLSSDSATPSIKKRIALPKITIPAFRFPFQSKRWGNPGLKLIASFVLVTFLFTALFYGLGELNIFIKPVQAGEITIKAQAQDKLGVDTGSTFLLTSQNPLDEKLVEKNLLIEPAVTFSLEKKAGGLEYTIVPKEKLASDTIYRLSFDPEGMDRDSYSWAFQTKGSFRVLRSLPGNTTTGVPLNTGIEIVFSHENFDAGKADSYINIEPAVQGRFEKHKRTLVFVPTELQPATLYTVTVKQGFPLEGSSENLAQDYSFSFETNLPETAQSFVFDLDGRLTEFSTDDIPAFPVYFYRNTNMQKAPPLKISLYQYQDFKGFRASVAKRDEIPTWSYNSVHLYREDLSGLDKVGEYNTEFQSVDRYSHYIVFPQELAPGYYAAEFEAENCIRQIWFQVTDLAVYVAQNENNSIFWAHDLKSKTPAANMEVLVAGKNLTAKGDINGAVLLTGNIAGSDKEYAQVKSGNMETLVPLDLSYEERYNGPALKSRDYWKYLYLDRELFLPGDTVRFWGVISSRLKGISQVNEVTVELMGTDGPIYEGADTAPIQALSVKLEGNIFTGEMQLPVLKPGYYYFNVKSGETNLLSRGFSVETYTKPSYTLNITAEKRAIFAGEGMNFEAESSFFEGTPVPELKLDYHINGQQGSVVTDGKGLARIPYIGKTNDDLYSSYQSVYLGASANLPEAGEITGSSEVYVFKSKVYLNSSVTRKDNTFTLQAKLSTVDLTKVNEGNYPAEEFFLKGPAVNTLVKGSLYQDVWTKVEAGERYDFINKVVEKIYHYDHSTKHISDFDLITDSQGNITYTGTLDPEESYYLELSAQDNEGREFKRRYSVYGSERGYYPEYKYYYLQPEQAEKVFGEGDKVSVTFMENTKEIIPQKGKVLYFTAMKDIKFYEVSGSSRYTFTFSNDYVPNINIYGVYFDGRGYQEASPYLVPYKSAEKALQVKVETDKQEYRPKDMVKLNVRISDSGNQSVKSARVNLNLVDEAIYSLRDQSVDLLRSLYTDYIHTYLNTRRSHYHPENFGGAERGGEGGSERKDFRDTVLFVTLETDSGGWASTEFQLPDNLTSWRLTYHALTDSLQAGSGTHQIPVRLPFFVEMTNNSLYLEGDTPVIVLRAYGDKVSSGQEVSYKLKLVDSQGKEVTAAGNGTAFSSFDWQLPALREGIYKLTVSAQSGDYQDVITREISVVSSFLERTLTKTELLQDGLEIKGSFKEPVTLIFSDSEKSQYLSGLYNIAWMNGSRLEQKLASTEARKLLTQYFPEEKLYYGEDKNDSLLNYQQPDGGISILPYSESELALSAQIAAYHSEEFDKMGLAAYFYRLLEADAGTEDDDSLMLWGLAALKEPVLLKVNEKLADEKLASSEKINLAQASLEIGNGAFAKNVYNQLLNKYGEDLGAAMRINVGRDQDEIVEATTQMALLASRLEMPEKNKLFQYILENPGKEILNSLEQVQILKYALRYMDPDPVSFTYELRGEKITKSLQDHDTFKLIVPPDALPGLKFSQVQGKVGLLTKYSDAYDSTDITPRDDLSITRVYYKGKDRATTFERGDLVQVTLAYEIKDKAPAGYYEIVDILPAGLKYVSRPYIRGKKYDANLTYPTEVKDQKLTFAVPKRQNRITYYARVVSPGEYEAQSPLLSHTRSNKISVLGNRDRIIIK